MNTTLYLASLFLIIGGSLIAILAHYKDWIEEKIKNKKYLKWFKIISKLVSILLIIIGTFIGVNDLIDKNENAQYEGIFVTPTVISVPVKSGRDVPITVTNNLPYPIYMVGLVFTVTEGDIALDFGTNFMIQPFLGGSVMQKKYLSGHVPAILGKSSATYIFSINTKDFEKETKIEVEVSSYMKQPVPNWFKDNVKELPDTFKVPDGFMPDVIHINKKKK